MNMTDNYNFREIAPFDDSEFKEKLSALIDEPGFEDAVRWILPDVDFKELSATLRQIPDKDTFQLRIMRPILERLEANTTSGISYSGTNNIEPGQCYTYISNHRDIVLDASFLNLCLIRSGHPTSEIAIGDNLLIYDWITDVVKINKSFIVKRNLRAMQALDAARQLSAYIRYALHEKHESIWIAHREGRAKDSNDLTQESLIKMLALSGEGSTAERLAGNNLLPVSITYEYDPNDYLKAREFLLKHRDPSYKKSPGDDLKAMETGLLKHKGHVHFSFGKCISPELEKMADIKEKNKVIKNTCTLIDRHIHHNYKIFPVNYIAYDLLEITDINRDKYTVQQFNDFREYVERQLDRTNIPNLTPEGRGYMYKMMLTMYANPLRNKIKAEATSPLLYEK